MVNTVHLKWTAVRLRGSSPLLDRVIFTITDFVYSFNIYVNI